MPPMPPLASSYGGGGSSSFGRSSFPSSWSFRRFGRSSARSSSARSSVVSTPSSRWSVVDSEAGGGRAAAAVVAGDHDHRDHEADDHRDQAGDHQPHVAVGRWSGSGPSGPSSASGPRASPTPPVRVSRRGSRWCPRSQSRFAAASRSPRGCCPRPPSGSRAGGRRRGEPPLAGAAGAARVGSTGATAQVRAGARGRRRPLGAGDGSAASSPARARRFASSSAATSRSDWRRIAAAWRSSEPVGLLAQALGDDPVGPACASSR